MMRVCILGEKGMLGHMLRRYLSSVGVQVLYCDGRWPDTLKNNLLSMEFEYLINCIASIPNKSIDFKINYELPIWLDENINCSGIILPGTDATTETEYGKSKFIATDYMMKIGKRTKVIQCSIIGPEMIGSASLFQWFFDSDHSVEGYSNIHWNGITSLKWAGLAHHLISDWGKHEALILPYTDTITKYQLLLNIKEIWGLSTEVAPVTYGEKNYFPVQGNLKTESIKNQLSDLKNFYYI